MLYLSRRRALMVLYVSIDGHVGILKNTHYQPLHNLLLAKYF